MHVEDDTLLIGGNYIGTFSDYNNMTTVSFYFWLTAHGKDLEHAQNANSDMRYDACVSTCR